MNSGIPRQQTPAAAGDTRRHGGQAETAAFVPLRVAPAMADVETVTEPTSNPLAGRTLLRRDHHVPLYMQIRDRLVEAIRDGSLQVGDRIPAEPELGTQFRVGRPTVRQAIAVLRQEGLVLTRRGLGTFVASPSAEISLFGFDGLSRRLDGRGIAHSSELIRVDRQDHPRVEVVEVNAEGPWWGPVRLRRVEHQGVPQPLCIETDWFSEARCPEAEEAFARTGSATAVRHAFNIEIARAEVAIKAVAAPAAAAALLDMRPGQPLLYVERAHEDVDGTVAHVATFLIRTDLVPLVDRLQNPAVL